MTRFRNLITLAALILFLSMPHLRAFHLPGGHEWEVPPSRQRKIARKVHRVWHKKSVAHRWIGIISCESKGRKYARNGQYLGLTQMGEREREMSGWTWDMDDQLRATKRYWNMTGYYSWACS